jgi:hypothetical protein
MSFTFDPSLSKDLDLVRFHIGDTNPEGFYIHDNTINYFVTNYSVGEAVIACIKHIITQLSQPNFNLDWMSVSNTEARKSFEAILKDKRIEFGIPSAVAVCTKSLPQRADSYQQDADGLYEAITGDP